MRRFDRNYPIIFFMVVAAVVIAFAIVGIVYSVSLQSDFKVLKCGLYIFLNEAIRYLPS